MCHVLQQLNARILYSPIHWLHRRLKLKLQYSVKFYLKSNVMDGVCDMWLCAIVLFKQQNIFFYILYITFRWIVAISFMELSVTYSYNVVKGFLIVRVSVRSTWVKFEIWLHFHCPSCVYIHLQSLAVLHQCLCSTAAPIRPIEFIQHSQTTITQQQARQHRIRVQFSDESFHCPSIVRSTPCWCGDE